MERITEKYIWGIPDSNGFRFDISPKTIFEFLNANNNAVRKIPEYQRPYSWEKHHVEKLLNDILHFSKSHDEKSSWFLGTIYTTKKSSNDTLSLVLDGQQRLTTIQLILKELCFYFYQDNSIQFNDQSAIDKFHDFVEAANQCLYVNISSDYFPRFETEPTTNTFLKEYLLKTRRIKSHKDLKSFIQDFETSLSSSNSMNESLTLKTVREHIKTIRNFIRTNFLTIDGESPDLKLARLNNFFFTLLHKFWLIEIPLREEEFSLEIFEGINNRGKSLSLIDKLQFRSLTDATFNRQKIRNEWKEIYIKLEKLTESGVKSIFSSHEEFFKLYFLAIKGSEFKNDDDYLLEFDEVIQNEITLQENFFEKIKVILDFFIEVENPLRIDNTFCQTFPNARREREKITSLLHLLKKTLVIAGNGRQLLISFLYHNNPYQIDCDYNIPIGIWNIIRLVFTLDVIETHKSNIIRSHFNKINRNAKKDPNIFLKLTELFNPPSDNDDGNLSLSKIISINEKRVNYNLIGLSNNLISNSSNDESALVLFMYSYLKDIFSLCNGNELQYRKLDLEHIFPRTWKQYWSDKIYTKANVISEVIEIGKIKSISQELIDSICRDITTEIDFELKLYDKKPFIQEKSLIEWIGNKVCFHSSINSSISNKSFNEKKQSYLDSNLFLFPNSINEVAITSYEDFKSTQIVERSLEIVGHILENLYITDWDIRN
ncbi:MAG: DUF262 domain-containing protein [Bacteroidota bacterium]